MTQFRPNKASRMRVVSANSGNVGGNAYDPASDATRPRLSFPCKDIVNIDDVSIWCTAGYFGRISSHVKNVVVVRCYNPTNIADVKDHAAHAHDMVSALNKGTKAANVDTDQFGNATADYNIAGGSAVNGGVQNFAAMAHANATAAAGGIELNKNNSAFTVYGTALGFV